MFDPLPINGAAGPPDRVPVDKFASGDTAILLVESLIHGLIARSLISVADAVDIVDGAVEVREDFVRERGVAPGVDDASLIVLHAIRKSLSADIAGHDGQPGPSIG